MTLLCSEAACGLTVAQHAFASHRPTGGGEIERRTSPTVHPTAETDMTGALAFRGVACRGPEE